MTPSMGRMPLKAKLQLTLATRIPECGRAQVFDNIGPASIVSITGRKLRGQ